MLLKKLFPLMLLFLFGVSHQMFANNVQIDNVEIVGQDTELQHYIIQFDLSWENSWRVSDGPQNWDAAWVFLKFTRQNQHEWHHGEWYRETGDGANDGHVFPGIARMQIPEDQKGAFFHRATDGIGDFTLENIQLIWDYSNEEISDDEPLDLSVHAIEMVYIPEGPFYLGDNGPDVYAFQVAGTNGLPFYIDSEDEALTLGGSSSSNLSNGILIGEANLIDDFDEGTTQTLPAAWPMGYHAMYVMKYEATGAMYSDFYFTLTLSQNDDMAPDDCNTAIVDNYFMDFESPYKPVSCVSWEQISSYLDWAALRPLSETEYEKACRGPSYPVPNEFAWGNDVWFGANDANDIILANPGEPNEVIVDGISEDFPNGANVQGAYGNTPVHLRVGIFAASVQNPTRQNTGASFYGLMEMTGNARELVISLNSNQTRDFSGLHGDGEVASSGYASFSLLTDWAFLNDTGLHRKGEYDSSNISRRSHVLNSDSPTGFRGCRTAP